MTNVEEISARLIVALDLEMNMNASREDRLKARQFLEEFRETSPLCAPCGFHLASQVNPPVVRHNGLLLVEHCIRYKWNFMNLEEKVFIKETLMKLVASGTHNLLLEQYHIKNALAKGVVEIIKREWPQQWATLLDELYQLVKIGATQTELVLLILMVLAEDVIILQETQVQRRREIYLGLTCALGDIFAMFTTILRQSAEQKTSIGESDEQKQVCRQVACATLATLTVFLDWVPIVHLTHNDGLLLRIICSLLDDERLKFNAVECILTTVNRKGKVEDRQPLLSLFGESVISALVLAAKVAYETHLQEQSYQFLKRLCQVFTSLGSLLCSLWGVAKGIELPSTFSVYLEVSLQFTSHPSQILSNYTIALWSALFRHEQLSVLPVVTDLLPRVIEALAKKLLKVGFPSRTDFPSCSFSRLDFDSDEDFCAFFSKFRSECSDALKLSAVLTPQVAFSYATQWIQTLLLKPIETGTSDSVLCNLSSPSFLEWDAHCTCLESVMPRIPLSDETNGQIMVNQGIDILERVLAFQCQDPLILSSALSCISSLFVVVKFAPRVLPAVLERIFSTVVFSLPGQTKATRTRSVKNLRRHACSCLVKICKTNPKLLLPSFDNIYYRVQSLNGDREQLSQMEKVTLTEALVVLSNEFNDFQRQTKFLEQVFSPITSIWLSADMDNALSSVENFIGFIGLDKPPVEPGTDDLCGINRSQIICCLSMILAVIRRSSCPKDSAEATKGGFYSSSDSSTPAVIRNPVTEFVVPLLRSVFQIVRLFNSLWLPEVQARISPQFAKANDMIESDRNNALGLVHIQVDVSDMPVAKQPLERMQHFLSIVHDNCQHILGNCGVSLTHGFYNVPDLSSCLISTVFSNLTNVPDYRLRLLIRAFMKSFVLSCPPQYYKTAVIPVLACICPFMFQRLNQKWISLDQKLQKIDETEDDNVEVQEIIEEQLHRQLTKEHLDLLIAVIQPSKEGQASDASQDGGNAMDEDETTVAHPVQLDTLSELGMLVFKDQMLYPPIVMNIFSALFWNDTTVSIKAIPLCLPSVKQLIAEGHLGQEEANFVMRSVLLGLQQHGQHEANNSLLTNLGFFIYQVVRPLYPGIVQIMLQVPGCTELSIQQFDSKIFGTTNQAKQLTEKKKKEYFRTLINGAIGKSLAQRFGRQVLIKDLPKLFRLPKPEKPSIVDTAEEPFNVGFCRLFAPETANVATTKPVQ